MSKKKKIVILSLMIALLTITAVFNFVLTGESVVDTYTSSDTNYFSQYRNERLTNRNEELVQLDSIISSAQSTSTEITDALSLKLELTEMTEKEMLLESLIKAYGFDDVVVIIGLDSDNVNVIAKSNNLTPDDAIAIYTIVSEEKVASPENVKIIPIS